MASAKRKRSRGSGWFGPMAAQDELVLFVLVNALDVFMTYWLLQHEGFTESNPVALFFIHRWGPKGMIYFKFGMVAFVCVIAHIVGQQRPELASKFLTLGTLIVGGVVVYSAMLYFRHGPPLPLAP